MTKITVCHLVSLIACVIVAAVPVRAEELDPHADEVLLPYRYAFLSSNQTHYYLTPGSASQMLPLRYGTSGTTWVSIKNEVRTEDGQIWYLVGEDEYVMAEDVLLASPSTFRGVSVGDTDHASFGFVVATNLNLRTRPGVAPENPPVTTLPRYTVVSILGQAAIDEEVWYRIGPDHYVHSKYIRLTTPTPRPVGVAPGEKWIAVNLTEQTLAAYEGDRMVLATLVSTGRPGTWTPEGLFRIWIKLETSKMSGGSAEQGDYYYLQDVPWTMYFHGSYGLHAAYWHDGFGDPRSRGCVNLSPLDAKWLFDWTTPSIPEGGQAVLQSADNPGTWVYVYRDIDEPA